MRKTFVLDTNVLLHNAQALESFKDNEVVIPMVVIEELDRFKKNPDELGRNARQVIRKLDELRVKGNLAKGVHLDNANGETAAGIVRIVTGHGNISDTDLDMDIPDNRVLRVAYHLFKEGSNVIFISKDINLRIKADTLGMQVMDFEKEKVNFDELFTGYREMPMPGQAIDEFYQEKSIELHGSELYPNEFVLLRDEQNLKHGAIGCVKGENVLELLNPRYDEKVWNIHPRNKEQRMALELLMDPKIQIVTLVGQAGTGKTLLALAAALECVLHQSEYERILVSRPIVPLGHDIGFLPGDKEEKIRHWMQPIFDNLDYLLHGDKDKDKKDNHHSGAKSIEEMLRSNRLELEAITYIRGRSIPRQFVIVDEAQNLTPHEIKTIVSRAGEGTKMVLTGDAYQIDNPYLDASSNGLSYTVERLKKLSIHGHMTLRKSERSPLAAAAAEYL